MDSSKTAVIFEVREFCLHDGPGVRTTVFFKGCSLRCAWCHNPEGLSPEPEVLFKEKLCARCGNCRNIPPDDLSASERVCPHRAKVVCGRRWTVPELASELLANADVFEASGGGITFSGGEPLMQAAFLAELADHLRPQINLAIETSGYASPDGYRDVVSRMDLVFQDLKHPDSVAHRKWTGVDPAPIHANLRWLKDSGKPFVARIPLIPGVNDSPEAKEGFARLLEGRSGLQRVELLPYHLAAGAKYQFVGRTYQPGFDESRQPDTDLTPFRTHGLPAVVM
jgi:pyruvate formate lyase activating enzyme